MSSMKNSFISLMKAKKNGLAVPFTDIMQMNYNVLSTAPFQKVLLFVCAIEFNILRVWYVRSQSSVYIKNEPIK